MKKHAHIFIYAFIALVSLGIMIYHSGDFSLWNDDMAMLGMCSKGFTFREMIRSAVENDRMPVLYHILFFLFNKFAVGDFAFKFSSMIFTAAGIFTCGLLGKRLGNTIVGTITACVSAYQICSPFGDFLRPYAMLFFVMSVVFLLYAKRFEERGNETIKTQIILGVIYGIAVNLHYTAILVLFVLFITDLVMILSKKSKPVAFVSYIVCALMFIPWFIIGIIVPAIKGNSYMAARVAEDTVPLTRGQMKKRLLDMKSLTPFIPGLAVYCLVLLAALKNRLTDKDRICGVFIVAFVINFVIVTILGRDPALYLSSRFYVPVMPVLAVCMGLSVSWIVNSIHLPRIAGVAVAFTAVAICLFCVHKSYLPGSRFFINNHKSGTYKEAAEYLLSRKDIHSPHTLVAEADCTVMRYLGWHDHYLTEDLTAEEVRVPARVLPIPNNVNKIYYCQNFGHRDGMDKERAALLRDFNLTSTEIITGKMGYGKTIIEVYERRKTD